VDRGSATAVRNAVHRFCFLCYFKLVVTVRTARLINIHKFYVLPTQCIYVFGVDLRTNSDYFPIQH
jgi:hypothetical protein